MAPAPSAQVVNLTEPISALGCNHQTYVVAEAIMEKPDFSKSLLPVVGYLGVCAGAAVIIALLVALLRASAH